MIAGRSHLVINFLVYFVEMDPQLHQTRQTDQPQLMFDI